MKTDDPRRLHVLEVPFWDYGTGPMRQTAGITAPLLGTPAVDDVFERVTRTVERCPKLTHRVADTRYRLRRPRWEPDPAFDLSDHFHHVRLGPGSTRDDFYAFFSSIFQIPLDPNRPQWDAWYVENVDGGSVLAFRVNHVTIDGLSAVEWVRTYSDQCRDLEDVSEALRTSADRATAARTAPDEVPEEVSEVTAAKTGLGAKLAGTASNLRNLLWPEQTPVWNERIGPRRTLTWASLSMDTIREIRAASGTTMTGVYDTVLSMAVEQLHPGLPAEFPVSLPMSVRHLYPQLDLLDLNSRQISTPLSVPLHVDDPAERLIETNRRISSLKLERRSFLRMAEVAERVPRPALLAATKRKMRSSNLIASSCPGPKERWTLHGVEIDDILLYTGLVPCNPIAFVGTAYADHLSIGVTADPDLIPRVLDVPKALEASLDELHAAVLRRSP